VKHLVILSLLLLSAKAWSCSCSGIEPIDEVIARVPVLVEARVVSLDEFNSPQSGRQVHSATLQVEQTLKGSVTSKTVTVGFVRCYASLYPALMKLQHTYVLPLRPTESGRYALAECAHSGMELIDGKLYTLEHTKDTQRRLQFYKKYSDFQRKYRK
jgi:hypothetical protein